MDPNDQSNTPASNDVPAENGAQVVLDLENMIKNTVATIDRAKAELKKQKEMLTSALDNDETYRLHNDEAKKAAKQKSSTRAQILSQPANKSLAEKIKDVTVQVKEATQALSDYLREYARMSGTNEIETEDGEVREIVYTAKLVKKSSR